MESQQYFGLLDGFVGVVVVGGRGGGEVDTTDLFQEILEKKITFFLFSI